MRQAQHAVRYIVWQEGLQKFRIGNILMAVTNQIGSVNIDVDRRLDINPKSGKTMAISIKDI